jgi:hypothetical protein
VFPSYLELLYIFILAVFVVVLLCRPTPIYQNWNGKRLFTACIIFYWLYVTTHPNCSFDPIRVTLFRFCTQRSTAKPSPIWIIAQPSFVFRNLICKPTNPTVQLQSTIHNIEHSQYCDTYTQHIAVEAKNVEQSISIGFLWIKPINHHDWSLLWSWCVRSSWGLWYGCRPIPWSWRSRVKWLPAIICFHTIPNTR